MKLWKIMNVFWLCLFILGLVFLAVRKVDGAGVVQTPAIRAISIGVLAIPFLFIAIIQVIWGKRLKQKP